MPNVNWKPARSLQACVEIMTAPGQFHEMEHAIIDGRVYRVYKNLWPSIREFWRTTVTENTLVHDLDYLVFEDTRITYGQADQMVQRAASVLREVYGVRKGDRIAIAMRNYPEWVIVFWAAAILGAVPTAINAWLPIDALLHCITLTSPKVIVLDSERLSVLSSKLPTLHLSVLLVRPDGSYKPVSGVRVKEWNQALSSYTGPIDAWKKEPQILPDDDACIYFTSGTTGLPKGVLSTHRNWLGNAFNALAGQRRGELRDGKDCVTPSPTETNRPSALVVVPLFHVTASTSQMLTTTGIGGKLVLMRKVCVILSAKLLVDEVVTSTVGVPSIVYDLFESTAVGEWASTYPCKGLGTGGAPAADSLPSEVAAKFPNAIVCQGYGLSETNSIAVHSVGKDYLLRPGSTGLPPPVVDLLVVDPNTNKVLPPDTIGELWIRGPNVMRGYYKNPKATAESITRDGWLKTGDLATIDEEGFVYIKDRVKDMIIRGGENIHSVTVENALFADKRVHDCAVVGIPDKRLGELVGAVVVLRPEYIGKVSEADLLEKVRPILPAFAVPSMITIKTETIDRNAAGKTLKKEIRKQLARDWERRNKAISNAKL
ncbi:hypothetical protein BU17DRAFT_55903 [Hysterangium stoloniferum]|nr:hypothetical protein BU17DRAFT_55903 [Hysterangium stoloniferum]